MLLAIDTATAFTGLALYSPRGPLAECVWESGRNHTAQLLPQIDTLLRYVGATPADLTALAVSLGPGSWSGLRVGLSLAKGMALAGDLPLIGIPTLDALAYQYLPTALPVYPLIRLGRERYATAPFILRQRLERLAPDRNLTLGELCAEISGRALFCGDLDPATMAALQRGLGERAVFPLPAARLRRPAFLAELAWQRHLEQRYDDLATLEPIYLGEPVRAPVTGASSQ
ncbi:tRNA (adenosine(37)-N6)-threonylcarbamoyltransferase complex dimerization subunit type 1 TsaB [Chloroflexus sp.]|uniref:tRNA (adenosine(37)-N6)-threonylcarbamoyltransferase complex dimerization subunit type 1 TsaB n=1 Tax=Chloroflexus sp. TaxID=1904827 RepID=UPI00260647AF|nr:tRNA (adenosine(37)-N6)-threonylcarbamoyltransferase complex dimerization subunit type 1 TsaB [uncultured Chloroflexus sp.]